MKKASESVNQFKGTAKQFAAAAERLAHRFPVFCPWCLAEGRSAISGWSSIKGTSRICERHDREMKNEIAVIAQRR